MRVEGPNEIERILETAALVASVTREDMLGRSRIREFVRARDLAALLLWRFGQQDEQIAKILGGRERSTISTARKRAQERSNNDKTFAGFILRAKALLSIKPEE